MRLPLLLLTIFTTVSALCQPAAPADEVHASLLQSKKKYLIAYAGKDHSFTMDVTGGRTAKLSDVPGFINIGGQIIQSTLVPVDPSIHIDAMTEAREKDLLLKYMNYELDYYRKKLKQRYTNLQTEWITEGNRLFLVWYFDMPENYKLVSKQLYFSTLFYGQVVDLNAPLFKTNDFAKARTILRGLVSSMKTYDKQLDLSKLGKTLTK
jgi:hypothetical protein